MSTFSASGLHLGPAHPLAGVARERCHHMLPWVGGVACGACWESAIRDDERFVVENDLSSELVLEDDLVDEIAVERAAAGEPVRLPREERRAAIAVLLARGERLDTSPGASA